MVAVSAAATAVSGTASTIPLASLFTINLAPSAYNFNVVPTYAGVTVSNAGVVSVAANAAAGTAHIIATSKTDSSVTADKPVVISAAPPVKTITGKTKATAQAGSTVPFADLFTLSGGAVASDFTYAVNPAHTGASVSAAGVVTLANNTSTTGNVTVVATPVVGTSVVSGNGVITTITAAKNVNGKIVPVGKKGTDVIPPADLFAFTNGAAISDVSGVAVVPSGAGTWDNTTGLTLDTAATGDVTLTYNVGSSVVKGSTVPTVTGVVVGP